MPTVRLSFSPAAAHVRTARLVGVAVARRAGVAEELLEEIRLAIGEACSRAVALHRSHGVADLVDVAMDDGERFTVRVIDRTGNSATLSSPPPRDGLYLAVTRASRPDGADVPGADVPGASTVSAPPTAPAPGTPNGRESTGEEAVVARMGLALLAGLVEDLAVTSVGDGLGTEVSMSWPVVRRMSDG